MNDEIVNQRIGRAKELVKTVHHAAMATVNEDGSPHNTPFFYVIDESREHIYWSSSPDSLHSRNLARTGTAFIVIYEPNVGGGLYLQADNAHELTGSELERGLEVINATRSQGDKPPIGPEIYTGKSPQRMYRVTITHYSVNVSEKNAAGDTVRDTRHEIQSKDLLA